VNTTNNEVSSIGDVISSGATGLNAEVNEIIVQIEMKKF